MPGAVKVSGQLLAMRKVFRRKESDDPKKGMNPGEQVMRALLKDNPEKFLGLMGKLEAEHRARKDEAAARLRKGSEAATPAAPDAGSLVGFNRAEEFLRGLT